MREILLTDEPIDPASALSAITDASNGAGAIVSFSGLVRPGSSQGQVTALRLEAHPVLTLEGMNGAADEAEKRWTLNALTIIHRIGDIKASEPIVFVAAASTHRRAAFEAADFVMDYMKTRAVFWKKEIGLDGSRWIEPRAEDHSDFARWAKKEEA